MIKVKVSIPNSVPPIVRQTPSSSARWSDCKFYINTEVEECDYWFVLDELDDRESTLCPSENLFLITGEPPFVKIYPRKYVSQFSHTLTCQKRLLKSDTACRSIPALPWMVGAKLEGLPAVWNQKQYLDYNFFKNEQVIEKKNKLAIITSNKAFTKGHRKRLDFVLALKKQMPELVDLFGAGFEQIGDKYDVLSKYKYSLVIENCKYSNYWTEKLSDAYLSSTFPFYSGCPNINEYFPEKAFEFLDLNDINAAIAKIQTAINHDLYSDRVQDILFAKNLVLDKYNLFAIMADAIFINEMNSEMKQKRKCTIYPLRITIETKIRTRVLKYLGLEI